MESIAAAPETALNLIARAVALLEGAAAADALHPRETAVLASLAAALAALQLSAETLLAAGRQRYAEGYADCRAHFCADCTPQPVLTLVAGQRQPPPAAAMRCVRPTARAPRRQRQV